MRALTNREYTLRLDVTDNDGNLVSADTDPTVTLKDADGTTVTSGTATEDATGEYAFEAEPHDTPGVYTAEWSVTVNGHDRTTVRDVDLVESRLAPLAAIRKALDAETQEWSGPSVRGEVVRAVLAEVEDWFHDALNYPPYLRADRVNVDVPSLRPRVRVPSITRPVEVLAVSSPDTSTGLPSPSDVLLRPPFLKIDGGKRWNDIRYTLDLKHGLEVVPHDLRKAAVRFAEHVADENDLPARASSVSTGDGAVISLALPSPARPTGIPDVDGVLRRYRLPAAV